jgi:protein gp37
MFRDKLRYGQDPTDIHRSADATFRAPLRWQRRIDSGKDGGVDRTVFTCSWSDWFIEEADAWRDDGWEVIRRCPDLIFQVLTKRAGRMADHLPAYWDEIRGRCWLGVSAEDQRNYDRRRASVDADLAPVMWWSLEPLLGPIDLDLAGYRHRPAWSVIGGESGPKARPFDLDWARSLVVQCRAGGVAAFVKQAGSHPVEGGRRLALRDPHGGDPSEWPEDLRVREFPAIPEVAPA